MNTIKLDIEDYNMEGTVLGKGRTTHPIGGSATTDQIGIWVLKSTLGHGSSGAVFLQEHTTNGALRAVKMLSRGSQSAICREISSMLSLKNYRRQFVDFHAWYEVDVTYIAMEYVSGGDLKAYIGKVGALHEAAAKGITEQILQALFILHDHNFVHCDLKPENIFIAGLSPLTIKVADFGQMKQLEGSYNSVSGTRAWAAPEQSSPNYRKEVDLWGAGCVVYFLLTSLNPFLAENDKSPMAMIEKYTFPAWPRIPRDKFQLHRTRRYPGDQIVVRGVTIEANDFLSNLIVRSPAGRMSVYAALEHAWICDTTPLESALRQCDLPLSRLLARHDQRYKAAWEDPLPTQVSHIILRFAAAHGHLGLVTLALDTLPSWLTFCPELSFWPELLDWPSTLSPLIGAAKGGHLEIINLLLRPYRVLDSDLFLALQAAVHGGHQQIQAVLLPLFMPPMFDSPMFHSHECCGMIAGFMDRTMLITTIEQYKKKSTSQSGLVRVDVDVDCCGYRLFFPTMLTSAMETGNIENIKHLLSDPPARNMLIKGNIILEAARIGRLDVVQLLVESYTMELGITPVVLQDVLDAASGKSDLNVVQYLLTRGVRPLQHTFETAVLKKNKALFQLLLKALIHEGSPRDLEFALDWAMYSIPFCDLGLLRWLDRALRWLDRAPSPLNLSGISRVTTSRGLNISDAARTGDLEVVKYLLADENPYSGPTSLLSMALVGAIIGGHLHIVQDLCVRDIDLTTRELWRVGARKGHVQILELLLRCGRPLQGVMDQALGLAAKAGHLDVVMLLLHNGALWNGPCGPVISGVLAAFAHRGGALPQIGAPASRRSRRSFHVVDK